MSMTLESSGGGSVCEKLVEKLRNSIIHGEFKPGQLIGSEYGISRDEKISRMTVRKASEVLINEGLIERRPGKGLYICGSATRTVQVVAGNLDWDQASRISRGAQAVGRDSGWQMQIYDAHGSVEIDLEVIRKLPTSGMSGAIILSLHSTAFNDVLCRLRVEQFPFVLVDQRLKEINAPSVVSDNVRGGYEVGKMLLECGHRRIAFLGDLEATTVQDHLTGLRDAIGDAGAPFDRSMVMDFLEEEDRFGDWSERIGLCAAGLMRRAVKPTAIFCSCDAVARGVYKTLGQMGLRIPEDVSVVGFDDDPLAEWLTPGLTTVRQSFEQIGRTAMELLETMIDHPGGKVRGAVVPVELVRRASVAAPRD